MCRLGEFRFLDLFISWGFFIWFLPKTVFLLGFFLPLHSASTDFFETPSRIHRLRGTILATHPTTGTVEVVFDETFIGGNTLHGLCKNGRGRVVRWTDLLAVDAANVVEPRSPGEIAEEKRKKEEARVALLAYNRAVAAKEREDRRLEQKQEKASASSSSQKDEATRARKAAKKQAKKEAKKQSKLAKEPILAVKQLLKRKPVSKEKEHLQNLLKNATVKKTTTGKAASQSTAPKNPKEAAHLQKLFSNVKVASAASVPASASEAASAKESAHLQKLLANANKKPASATSSAPATQPQQAQQRAMAPPMMMGPRPGMVPMMIMPRGMPMGMPMMPNMVPGIPNMVSYFRGCISSRIEAPAHVFVLDFHFPLQNTLVPSHADDGGSSAPRHDAVQTQRRQWRRYARDWPHAHRWQPWPHAHRRCTVQRRGIFK